MIIRKASDRPIPGTGDGAVTPAQAAMIEKQRSKYFILVCGHASTWEVDRLYSFGRPHKNKSWCEKCSKWSDIMLTGQIHKVYPNEPMF